MVARCYSHERLQTTSLALSVELYSVRRQQNPLHSDSWGLYIAADGALSTVRLLYRVPDGQKTVVDGHVFSRDKGKRYLLHIANLRHDKRVMWSTIVVFLAYRGPGRYKVNTGRVDLPYRSWPVYYAVDRPIEQIVPEYLQVHTRFKLHSSHHSKLLRSRTDL